MHFRYNHHNYLKMILKCTAKNIFSCFEQLREAEKNTIWDWTFCVDWPFILGSLLIKIFIEFFLSDQYLSEHFIQRKYYCLIKEAVEIFRNTNNLKSNFCTLLYLLNMFFLFDLFILYQVGTLCLTCWFLGDLFISFKNFA